MQKIAASAVVAAFMLACCTIQSLAQAPFKPPEVTSASDVTYPIQSIADGVVVLDVSLDDKGAITGSAVVRDIPSLTSAATSSVQSWKFAPASRQGKPEASVLRVAVVFRPRSYLAAGPMFTSVPSSEGMDQEYASPGIASVAYPQYPINAAVPGTVVIQVTAGKSNAIQRLKIVRDLPPFTQFALGAVNRWRFQAATLDGKPTTSTLAIAFVFSRLSSSEF